MDKRERNLFSNFIWSAFLGLTIPEETWIFHTYLMHYPAIVLAGQHTNQGTGSYPLPPQGWQLEIRLTDNHPPLKSPCFFNA
jgi:hypothetical protein